MNFSKDNSLLKKIQLGDESALEVLYCKYFQSLCEFASSYIKEIELAEEIVSDIFCSIWIKRNEIIIRSNIKSYLFASVKYKALDQLKKKSYIRNEIEAFDKEDYADDTIVLYEINYQDLEKEVNAMIDELPPQRKKVFKLNRFEGLKYKEIAEILDISVNTVQKQMIEAIKHIERYRYKFEQLYPEIINKGVMINKKSAGS